MFRKQKDFIHIHSEVPKRAKRGVSKVRQRLKSGRLEHNWNKSGQNAEKIIPHENADNDKRGNYDG